MAAVCVDEEYCGGRFSNEQGIMCSGVDRGVAAQRKRAREHIEDVSALVERHSLVAVFTSNDDRHSFWIGRAREKVFIAREGVRCSTVGT